MRRGHLRCRDVGGHARLPFAREACGHLRGDLSSVDICRMCRVRLRQGVVAEAPRRSFGGAGKRIGHRRCGAKPDRGDGQV